MQAAMPDAGTPRERLAALLRDELERLTRDRLAPAVAVLGAEPDQFGSVTAETLVRKAVRALLAEPSTEAVAVAVPPSERRVARNR